MEVKVTARGDLPDTGASVAPQPRTTTATHSAPPKLQGRRGRNVVAGFVFMLFLGAAAAGGYRWWQHLNAWEKTDNAYVAGHVHQVSSRIAGTVAEVIADDNAMVAEGAVLARLDRSDLNVKRQQALAELSRADADIARAESELARAAAAVKQQEANWRKTRLDLDRANQLVAGAAGAISRQEFDHAAAAHEAQQAALAGAQSSVKSAEALRAAGVSQREAAAAALAEIELQLAYADIRAPASGRIGRKNIEAGNRVQPGQALLALVAEEVWIVANFKETQLARMRIGQQVKIRLDAFAKRVVTGKLESFSPASGAQFALLPPDNATGNFTRVVQRVPVKITFARDALHDLRDRIVPGMSAIVEVCVRE